jgi:hypothetical protein
VDVLTIRRNDAPSADPVRVRADCKAAAVLRATAIRVGLGAVAMSPTIRSGSKPGARAGVGVVEAPWSSLS